MANTYTKLLYHLVFSTKGRVPVITPKLREPLYAYLGGIVREHRGVLMKVGGMPDHIHMLVNLRSEPSVASHLKAIKGSSSGWLNKNYPNRRFAWQAGYGAFSVSESQARYLLRYIENQEEHHRRLSFDDEIVGLLERHGIPYKEQYVLG